MCISSLSTKALKNKEVNTLRNLTSLLKWHHVPPSPSWGGIIPMVSGRISQASYFNSGVSFSSSEK